MAVHVQTGAMPSPTDINFIVIEIQNEERRHFPALQKPWQSSGPETYGRIDMEIYAETAMGAKTFPGIAKAMAEQWAGDIRED